MKESERLGLSLVISIPENCHCRIVLQNNNTTYVEVYDSPPPSPNSSGLVENAENSCTEPRVIENTQEPVCTEVRQIESAQEPACTEVRLTESIQEPAACTKEADSTAANTNLQQHITESVQSLCTSPSGLKSVENINGCANVVDAREVADAPQVCSEEQEQVTNRDIDNTVCSDTEHECIEHGKENVCSDDEIAALEQLRQLKRQRIEEHVQDTNSANVGDCLSAEVLTPHCVSTSNDQQQHNMADTIEKDVTMDVQDETYIFSITSDFDERQHPKIRLLAEVYDKAGQTGHVMHQNSAKRHRKAINRIMKT